MTKPYPGLLNTSPYPSRELPPEQFLTRDEARALLRQRPPAAVRILLGIGRLRPATCGERQPGVERASVEEELTKRTKRLWRTRLLLHALWHYSTP